MNKIVKPVLAALSANGLTPEFHKVGGGQFT